MFGDTFLILYMFSDWACTQIQLKVKAMNIFYHNYVLLIFIY